MNDGVLEERSERLAERVDALAAALRAAGVEEERASRLLTNASTAVLKALALDLLLVEPSTNGAEPARNGAEPTAEPDVSLAA